VLRSVSTKRVVMLLAGTVAAIVGCLPIDFGNWSEQVLSFPAPQPLVGPQVNEVEPNNDMVHANLVQHDGQVKLTGTIRANGSLDFDVYDLGPAEAGDRVIADLIAAAGSDIVLGLFDDEFNVLGYVDYSRGIAAPGRIDIVLREPVGTLYAVATARSVTQSDRAYSVNLSITPDVAIPPPNPQIVVLNFRGAAGVRIGRQAPVNVPPFDIGTIDASFTGQTQNIIQSVLVKVREDYAGLNVSFYVAGDPNLPAGDVTIIHFGTYSDRYLGLADNVDPFNRDSTQNAIIYTDTFSLFAPLRPTFDQMSQVLANVTSHELGHLLGLRHTADTDDLMDITASARKMLFDQWHKVAELHPSIMSIGNQDAATMLSWCVGGTPPLPPDGSGSKAQRMAKMADDPNDFEIPREWLATNSAEADQVAEDQPDAQ
jgi:hypothetical protein